MKVQIFPKPARPSGDQNSPMGALTLKPSAYQARPWELTGVDLFNHYEGTGTLRFHLRGSRVIRVAQSGWMRDRVRFLYDGLKRQRLTRPYHLGTPVGWSTGVTLWVTLGARRSPTFRVDPEGVHFYWLLRGYNLFRDSRGGPLGVTLDTPVGGEVYHGGFGLKPVERAGLSLPGWLTPEEEGHLAGPVGGVSLFLLTAGVAQLWATPAGTFRWAYVTPGDEHPRERNRSLFQVSPLQRLLPGW